jgi:hypothetical protein
MTEQTLTIKAGPYTDDLKNFIMRGLSNEQIDKVDLHLERSKSTGLAREPTIIAVVIAIKGGEAIGTAIVGTVGFLIAKWMDQRYDREKTNQIIELFEDDPEQAKLLMKHLDKYESIAIKQERYLIKPE